MTLPQATSWLFLLVGALLLSALLGPYVSAPQEQSRAAAPAVASEQASPVQQVALSARPQLIVPVAQAADLADTWGHARSEGRTHEGVDILAPVGTPVLAVADGRIVKFFDSERGGVTIYQFDTRERFVYYYAHLNARAAGLAEGDSVQQGDVIGFVGQSGNAPVPHLHFEIQRLTPERRWWVADSINPFPYLVSGRAPQ